MVLKYLVSINMNIIYDKSINSTKYDDSLLKLKIQSPFKRNIYPSGFNNLKARTIDIVEKSSKPSVAALDSIKKTPLSFISWTKGRNSNENDDKISINDVLEDPYADVAGSFYGIGRLTKSISDYIETNTNFDERKSGQDYNEVVLLEMTKYKDSKSPRPLQTLVSKIIRNLIQE